MTSKTGRDGVLLDEEQARTAREVRRYGVSFRILEAYDVLADVFAWRLDLFVEGEQYVVQFRKSDPKLLPLEVASVLRDFARCITKKEKKKAAK